MKRLRGCLLVVVVLLVVSVAAIGFGYWDQYTYDAKVPLGTWSGMFTSPTGTKGAILAVVVRKQLGTGIDSRYNGQGNSVTFDGSVRLCIAAQAGQHFALHGYTDITGPGFTFELGRVSGPASGQRFPDGLHGERRQETLAMSGQLAPFTPDGDVSPATNEMHLTAITMSKGDEARYAEACRALGAQGN